MTAGEKIERLNTLLWNATTWIYDHVCGEEDYKHVLVDYVCMTEDEADRLIKGLDPIE